MSERRHGQVANADEVEPSAGPAVGGYRSSLRFLGRATGGKALGCTHYEVPPGAAAFPFHSHQANEEALIVLSGTGTLRLGDERIALRAGDYVALPTGQAHQVRNTGSDVLKYYCLSTKLDPEVCAYPDSGNVATFFDTPAGRVRRVFKESAQVDYFDGDPIAAEPE